MPRGKEIIKKNHYFHSLNMPIYLFFYFIALVIAINLAWSAFLFSLFFASNIPMPGKHSTLETDLEHVPINVG